MPIVSSIDRNLELTKIHNLLRETRNWNRRLIIELNIGVAKLYPNANEGDMLRFALQQNRVVLQITSNLFYEALDIADGYGLSWDINHTSEREMKFVLKNE